jgi:hypothetical protein
MAMDPVRRRTRRAAKRVERQRRKAPAVRTPTKVARPSRGPQSGPGFLEPSPPSWPDDLDGGAGVREPRRPHPTMPAGALELDVPEPQYLELAAESA